MNQGEFSPYDLLRILLSLFSSCFYIWLFYYKLYVPIIYSKTVLYPDQKVVGIPFHIFSLLACKIFFRFRECPHLPLMIDLISASFNLLSFTRTFWFISSSYIVCSNCVALLFSSRHILAFSRCLNSFACFCRFLFCVSSLISHPGFEFLCVLLRNPNFFRD